MCLVKWQSGEETWEPFQLIRKDAPLVIAEFAQANNLLDSFGYRWCRSLLKPKNDKNEKSSGTEKKS